jgi:hypothetical protein
VLLRVSDDFSFSTVPLSRKRKAVSDRPIHKWNKPSCTAGKPGRMILSVRPDTLGQTYKIILPCRWFTRFHASGYVPFPFWRFPFFTDFSFEVYRLEIGETENFIDLLFYNLSLSCYVVVEVKIGKFAFADIGQLGGYVVACNHLLRKEGRDNPTIGLLICKEKDRIQAQYALESSSQPLGISEYDLEKFYPEKVEGTMPTIEEIEAKLRDN